MQRRRYTGRICAGSTMATAVIDIYRFVTALKGTGKGANFTAEEIANAIDVSQGADLLTMTALEAKLDVLGAELKAEIKASQVQILMWLSGIVLASNGIVIAFLARLTHVV